MLLWWLNSFVEENQGIYYIQHIQHITFTELAKIAYNSIGQCVRLYSMTFQPHEGHKMVPYPLPCGLTHQFLSMVFEIRNSRELQHSYRSKIVNSCGTSYSLIRDSSDSNPRFFIVTCGGQSDSHRNLGLATPTKLQTKLVTLKFHIDFSLGTANNDYSFIISEIYVIYVSDHYNRN